METVRAWTRQVTQVLDEIDRSGRYVVKEEYVRLKNGSIADHYIEHYRWLTRQGRRHIDIPQDLDLPIWLALTEDQRLGCARGNVSLTLEVPQDKLLIVDYERWGYQLNDMYVPSSPQDENLFNAELRKYGISNEASLITGNMGNFYPILKQKVLKSWDRVFTPSPVISENVGCIWELRPEWIVHIERYD